MIIFRRDYQQKMFSRYSLQKNQKTPFGCPNLFTPSLGKKQRRSVGKSRHNEPKKQVTKIKLFSKLEKQSNSQYLRLQDHLIQPSTLCLSSGQRFQHKTRQFAKNGQLQNLYSQQSNKQSFQKLNSQCFIPLETPKFITLHSDHQNMPIFCKMDSFLKSTMAFTSTRKTIMQSFAQNSQHSQDKQSSISQIKLSIQLSNYQSDSSVQPLSNQVNKSAELFTNVGSPTPESPQLLFPKRIDKVQDDFRKKKIQLSDIRQVHTQFDQSEKSYSVKDRNISQFSQVVSNDQNFLRKYTQFSFGVTQNCDI